MTARPAGATQPCTRADAMARKDDAHYGLAFVEREVAAKLVRYADRMVETSRRLLEM